MFWALSTKIEPSGPSRCDGGRPSHWQMVRVKPTPKRRLNVAARASLLIASNATVESGGVICGE
jgi:hypothetical protein